MLEFAALKHLETLDALLAETVAGFTAAVSASERSFFEKLLTMTNRLELDPRQGIKKSVSNLRLVNELRRDMELALLDGQYGKAVQEMLGSFVAAQGPLNAYFSDMVGRYGADKLYAETTKLYIKATSQELLELGIKADYVPGITAILNQHVTTGAPLATLRKSLEQYVIADPKLSRHAPQVADDALNQYSRQYIQSQTADLSLSHYYYKGTLIETSRGFCQKHVGKYYTEAEVLSWGADAERGIKWPGQYKGTNRSNIKIVLGGYRCRHRLAPVTAEMYEAGLQRQADREKQQPPKPEEKPAKAKKPAKAPSADPVPAKDPPKPEKAPERPKFKPKELDNYPAKTDPAFWALHNRETPVDLSKTAKGAFYSGADKKVTLAINDRFERSKYYRESIIYHEYGHALHDSLGIHNQRTWLANGYRSEAGLEKAYVDCQKFTAGAKGKKLGEECQDLYSAIQKHFSPAQETPAKWRPLLDKLQADGWEKHDLYEMTSAAADTVAALTRGRHGWGHSKKYFSEYFGIKTRSEFFAHGMEFRFAGNPIAVELMPEIYGRMGEYFNALQPPKP